MTVTGDQPFHALLARFCVQRSNVDTRVRSNIRKPQVKEVFSVRQESRGDMILILTGCVQYRQRSGSSSASRYSPHLTLKGTKNDSSVTIPGPPIAKFGASQMVSGGPPLTSTFMILLLIGYAMYRLSGDQKNIGGSMSASAMRLDSSESMGRIQTPPVPSKLSALKATVRPSGETENLRTVFFSGAGISNF